SGTTHTFPVAFPNSVFVILGADASVSSMEYISTTALSNSQFSARGSNTSPAFNYIAIGK
ncbi:gp53-like domain-containing protein, partial [Escherichia coli]|uniref:gp53-like domain-containing protein n=1 Tax=Escherichia coli TaxID=562 RepID=UPI003EBEF187